MNTGIDTYLTLAGSSRGIYREKASKFIGLAFPVDTEDECRHQLELVRKEYYDANHHCFAYRIGIENPVFRSSDDGEPTGTAGKPIHNQILSAGLTNILIVVVRYFGGTKLGVPGLIHAYKTAASESIVAGKIITRIIEKKHSIEFDYINMNEVMRILKEEGVSILEQVSDNSCKIVFAVRMMNSERTVNRLKKIVNLKLT
jgi:uncharacterized YigZ family protein